MRTNHLIAASALLAGLAACAGPSPRVTDDGQPGGELVFPDIATTAWHPEGNVPTPKQLHQVTPGLDKDHLYALLGRPNFREGFRVREWDYIFKLPASPDAITLTTCQYKILFDKDMLARSFHWSPASCAAILTREPGSTTP
jgi:outer membrane protein assembly factor BamE (lipoprotein component of BamABCDE complex)